MVQLVSTQSFRDPETVAEKQGAGDYVVLVTPEFMLNGVPTRAVLDGHHSLAAAIADGVDPVLQEIGAGDSGGRTKPVLDACSCKPLDSGKSLADLEHKRQGVDAIVHEWVLSMAGGKPDAQIEMIDGLGVDGAVDQLLGEMGSDIADRGELLQAMRDYRDGLDEEQGEPAGAPDEDDTMSCKPDATKGDVVYGHFGTDKPDDSGDAEECDASDLEEFLAQRTSEDDSGSTRVSTLASAFSDWCAANGLKPCDTTTVTRMLSDLGYRRQRIAGDDRIIGMSMKSIDKADKAIGARFLYA